MPGAPAVDRVAATVSRARRGHHRGFPHQLQLAFCTGDFVGAPRPALLYGVRGGRGGLCGGAAESTFFVACLTLDVKRQAANKRDCLCCTTSAAGPTDGCCWHPYNPDAPSFAQVLIGDLPPNNHPAPGWQGGSGADLLFGSW